MAVRGTTAEIDLEELEKLCSLQCTDEELAAWFKVSVRTIERRRKEPQFGDVMERGKARGRMSIRRAQMRMLEAGNPAIAIWLGKNYLGQTEYASPGATAPAIYIYLPAVATTGATLAKALEAAESAAIDIGPGE